MAAAPQVLQDSIVSGNIPQLVLASLSHAISLRSSDIHIEPLKDTVRVRYRVDGVLRIIIEYPNNIHPAVVSRIKIMSNLKIDEQRMPQDGRAQVTTEDGREMDLRVSTLPTVNGEKVVMRIQDASRKVPTLEELGIEGRNLELLKESLALPNGVILTTGPTGSGKTTTLYSCLNILNQIDVNILTIEDPVEIQTNGLNQSQVHADIEYTFANGLRTALRQDPDIIMVGEIRDKETADISVEASLTGHLVLSTLHTNSAVETLTRIMNMGVPPFLITSTVNTIIAQRLVRRVCVDCKAPEQPDEVTMQRVRKSLDAMPETPEVDAAKKANPVFYKGAGCEKCGDSGYTGRVGLFELMQMNNSIRKLILDNASSLDIERAAVESGMFTLEHAGIIKALAGITSLEEVYRVARPEDF